MLALNEILQKVGVESKIRFSQVRYASSKSILALFMDKANATMFLPQQSNSLFQAAKTENNTIVAEETIEQWQRLNVYGILLERYLGLGKMRLLKREVKSSTSILLQATLYWLINKDQLSE